MATIRQVAVELGVSKQRVARWVKNRFGNGSLTISECGGRPTYDLTEEQVMEVKRHFIGVLSVDDGASGGVSRTASGDMSQYGSQDGSRTAPEWFGDTRPYARLVETLEAQIDDLKAERREMRLQMDKLTEMLEERADEVRARDAEIRELRERLDMPWWRKLISK